MLVPPAIELEPIDILFIGDDPDLAEMYRLKLELDGYWVRVVTPETAVAAARRQAPELIFLDLPADRLPRMAVLQAIRKATHQPDLPAIVLTPASQHDIGEQWPRLSACDYVVKLPETRPSGLAMA
jgi:DNA-binding response OmpR family regulator